jgi:hypothetical protein
MPYTVIVDGVPVQCETATEAVELARLHGGDHDKHGKRDSRGQNSNGIAGSRWTEQRVNDFYSLIKGQQRKLIDALMEHPDGRTDAQLFQLLGLPDGRALAGVWSGLWKNAKKVGADPNDLYVRSVVSIGDRDAYEYTLSDSFRRATQQRRQP